MNCLGKKINIINKYGKTPLRVSHPFFFDKKMLYIFTDLDD